MSGLDPQALRNRRILDYNALIATSAACPVFEAKAYANAADVRSDGPGLPREKAHAAVHWRWSFDQPTLSGPGKTTSGVVMHVDVGANGSYPFGAPACWVLSRPMPWSAHFKEGAPICLGDFWDRRGGTLLADLAEHVSRLLNFDEVARGGGYVGWNAASIAYWNKEMGGRPLVPDLVYPRMPADVLNPARAAANVASVFQPADGGLPGGDLDGMLFRPKPSRSEPAMFFRQKVGR
jgi:hypothetical protein